MMENIPGEQVGNVEDYLMLKRLIEGVFNNIGIKRLLHIIEMILKCPVIIVDMGFGVVTESPSVTDDIRYHFRYEDREFVDKSYIELIRSHYIYSKMSEREFTSAVMKGPEWEHFFVASIKVSEADVLMFIAMRDEVPFEPSDFVLIKKICQVMAVEFQKENAFNSYRLSIPNHTLSAIISGKAVSRDECFDKLSYLKWVRARQFYLMMVEDDQGGDLGVRKASVINALKLYIPTDHCLMYESHLVIYLTQKLYLKLCGKDNQELKSFLQLNHLRGAVSSGFFDILDSRTYYLMTSNLLKTAQKYNLSFVTFQKSQHYIVADLLEGQFAISDFCHPAIIKLIHYDKENHSDLLQTLECYLQYKNDVDKALEKLYIHRSTLFYRVKKIKELTGLGLEQIEEVSQLYFSLKLIEIYGKNYFLDVCKTDPA